MRSTMGLCLGTHTKVSYTHIIGKEKKNHAQNIFSIFLGKKRLMHIILIFLKKVAYTHVNDILGKKWPLRILLIFKKKWPIYKKGFN